MMTTNQPVKTISTEADSIVVINREPEMDDWETNSMSVECICGKTRYGIDRSCDYCTAAPNEINGYRIYNADKKLATSKREVKTRYWYHSTTQENWIEKVREANVPVHLGNKQAAFERAIDQCNETGNNTHFLYKVKLNTFAKVANNICPDLNNHWSESMDEFKRNTNGRSFVRYINSHEDAGSVSLYGDPHKFEVIEVTKESAY